jgi:hypothetical protein
LPNSAQVELAILHTDYLEYALVVTCDYIPELDVDDMNVFFLTRSLKPMPQGEIDLYIDMLDPDYAINPSNLYYLIGNEFVCS